MSNEKRAPGCLGFIGDDKLPGYVGIVINHYINDKYNGKSVFFLFVAHMSHFWAG